MTRAHFEFNESNGGRSAAFGRQTISSNEWHVSEWRWNLRVLFMVSAGEHIVCSLSGFIRTKTIPSCTSVVSRRCWLPLPLPLWRVCVCYRIEAF